MEHLSYLPTLNHNIFQYTHKRHSIAHPWGPGMFWVTSKWVLHPTAVIVMGLLPDMANCGLRMRRECRKHFPHHRLQRKLLVSDPGMHHGTCITHVPWCMSGSANPRWWGKHSRHSRRMRNPQYHVSGKRPNVCAISSYGFQIHN